MFLLAQNVSQGTEIRTPVLKQRPLSPRGDGSDSVKGRKHTSLSVSLLSVQPPNTSFSGGGGVGGGGGGCSSYVQSYFTNTCHNIFTATHHTLKQKRYQKHEAQCQNCTPVSIFTQRHKPSLYHQVLFFFDQTTKLLYRPEVPTQKGDSRMQHSREVIYKV